jgi:hypothetical protein
MFVGREPSHDHTETKGLGPYSFWKGEEGHVSDCGFWNTAYTVMARVNHAPNAEAGWAKQQCAPSRLSPVIFADALPRGLKNATVNKDAYRNQIGDDEIQRHVDHVFSHDHLIRRVGLVMISGLDKGEARRRASAILEATCARRKMPVAHIPFLCGNNAPAIMTSLTTPTRDRIRTIWTAAMDQVSPSGRALMTAA